MMNILTGLALIASALAIFIVGLYILGVIYRFLCRSCALYWDDFDDIFTSGFKLLVILVAIGIVCTIAYIIGEEFLLKYLKTWNL